MITPNIRTSLIFLLAAFICFPAYSDSYIGLGLSRVDTSTSNGTDTGDSNGITLYGGKHFNDIALEFGYTDLGDIEVPQSSIVISGNILKIHAVAGISPSKNLHFLGKLGIALIDMNNNIGFSTDDTELAWALGLEYQLSEKVAFRAEYEQYDDVSDLDLNLLTFSLNTSF